MGEGPHEGQSGEEGMNIGAEVREIIAESPTSKRLEPVPDVVPDEGLVPAVEAVMEEEVATAGV